MTALNSYLSLQPLVAVLKKMIAEGKPGAKRLYHGLINDLESKPGLLQPMKDASILEKDTELVETVLSTIFPPSTLSNQGIYAIAIPFSPETVYASPGFSELFLQDGSTISVSDKQTSIDLGRNSLGLAYDLVLRKFYSHPVPAIASFIHRYTDKNGLTRYYDLKLNAQFVEVRKMKEEDGR